MALGHASPEHYSLVFEYRISFLTPVVHIYHLCCARGACCAGVPDGAEPRKPKHYCGLFEQPRQATSLLLLSNMFRMLCRCA
jgi:hypothetical protein